MKGDIIHTSDGRSFEVIEIDGTKYWSEYRSPNDRAELIRTLKEHCPDQFVDSSR